MKKPLITVFTPTYNRAKTLPRVYASLVAQDSYNFCWLIIDDGSTDETAELVRAWQTVEKNFTIEYVYKKNGGMHTAHNRAYELITTELNLCIDSDDALAVGAITAIETKWQQVDQKNYCGLIGLDADFSGTLIGTGFAPKLKATTLQNYYAGGGKGDKKLVYRTEIIKKAPPYPVFSGEKYVALAYKYLVIDQKYQLAVLPEILVNVDYQLDGSSATMFRQYLQNPRGFAFWRIQQLRYGQRFSRQLIDAMHYVASSCLAKDWRFLQKVTKKKTVMLMIPCGVIWSWIIKFKGSVR